MPFDTLAMLLFDDNHVTFTVSASAGTMPAVSESVSPGVILFLGADMLMPVSGTVTVTVLEADTLPSTVVHVMTAVPLPMAVKVLADPITAATAVFEDDQTTPFSVAFDGVTTAETLKLLPFGMVYGLDEDEFA